MTTLVPRAAQLENAGEPARALDLIYDEVDDALLRGDFAAVDAIFPPLLPDTLSVRIILGLLSITAVAAEHLPSRRAFYMAAYDSLESRGRDAERYVGRLEAR